MPTLENIQSELDKLDLSGRDCLHTHLIQQEIPFWLNHIYSKSEIPADEIRDLARRRGLNPSEKLKLFKLARWLNKHAKELRACRPASSKHHAFMDGWTDGARSFTAKSKDRLYLSGHSAGKKARKTAETTKIECETRKRKA